MWEIVAGSHAAARDPILERCVAAKFPQVLKRFHEDILAEVVTVVVVAELTGGDTEGFLRDYRLGNGCRACSKVVWNANTARLAWMSSHSTSTGGPRSSEDFFAAKPGFHGESSLPCS